MRSPVTVQFRDGAMLDLRLRHDRPNRFTTAHWRGSAAAAWEWFTRPKTLAWVVTLLSSFCRTFTPGSRGVGSILARGARRLGFKSSQYLRHLHWRRRPSPLYRDGVAGRPDPASAH